LNMFDPPRLVRLMLPLYNSQYGCTDEADSIGLRSSRR
jgi:hypothetical protein